MTLHVKFLKNRILVVNILELIFEENMLIGGYF